MAADPPRPTQASLQPLTEERSEPPSSNAKSTEELPCGRSHHCCADPKDKMQVDPASDLLNSVDDQEKVPTTTDIQHFFERTSDSTTCRPCK